MTSSIRVLVADDERNLRELLVRELSRKGHAVEGVGDGEAALERLRDDPPDVLILDMRMPRLEGIEVLRRLAEQGEAPQVIVTTGFQEVSSAVEAMKLGAYDYLTKPTKIEELDILIRKAAEKGQLLRDNVALRAHAPGAEPPPPTVLRQMDLFRLLMAEPDSSRRFDLMRQVIDIAAQEFFAIGICLESVGVAPRNPAFCNVPATHFDSWLYPDPGPLNPCQFFIDPSVPQ